MDNLRQAQEDAIEERIRKAQRLINEVLLPIPRAWILALAAASFLSLLEVTRSADGGVTVSLHTTAITAILVGLVWLPFVIKVVALGGGALKTPVGEASTPGLEPWLQTAKDAVASGIAAVETAQSGASPTQQPALQQILRELQDKLVDLSTLSTTATAKYQTPAGLTTLHALARTYERLRATLPSGSQRTFEMTKVTAQARAAAQATPITSADAIELFKEEGDGSRIVALAVMRTRPDPAYLPFILEAIDHSRSAFEQYQALRTAQSLLPILNTEQKQQLAQVIYHQRSGEPRTHISRDSDRWAVSDDILGQIQSVSAVP